MLPHILHSTGRAVAVVHNQTHTIRNVLQLQSSGPSSGSGSSWGNGPGPGGAKYGAGSRFYAGHNSAGRAVTQANAVTSHDGQISQTDDIDDVPVKWTILPAQQRKRRMRSSSLSMGVAGRTERGEKLGVLKSVQLHARGRHAFTPNDSMALAKEKLLADPLPVTQPTQALLVRRNSTSAPLSPLLGASEPPLPPPKSPKPTQKQVDAAQAEAEADGAKEQPSKVEEEVEHFLSIAKGKDFAGCARSVRRMLASYDVPSVEMFNAALYATLQTRPTGAPIKPVLDLYNSMLAKSVMPTVETYETLIHALTTRDFEVHRAKMALDLRIKKEKESDGSLPSDNIEKARMKALYKEDNFASAMSLFEGVLAVDGKDQLMMSTFVRLINCAANHVDVHSAIHVYAQLETRKDITIPVQVYRYLIHAFSNAGQINEAEEIFNTFISAGAKNKLFQYTGKLVALGRQGHIQVWNSMIEAYFRAGLPDKAIGLVDQVLKSDAGNNFTTADIPVATSSMFTTVINGFLTTGDTESALMWFEKLLAQEPAPADPYQGLSGRVMRPDGQAWFLMMDHLADKGKVDDLNRLFKILKQQHEKSDEPVNSTIRLIVYTANMELLQKKRPKRSVVVENLKYLVQDINEYNGRDKEELLLEMCRELVAVGEFSAPCATFIHFVNSGFEHWTTAWSASTIQATSAFLQSISEAVHSGVGVPGFSEALPLARLVHRLGMRPDVRFAPIFLHAYGRMINGDDVEWNLSIDDWQLLLSYAMQFDLNMAAGNPANLQLFPGFLPQDMSSLFKRFHALGHSFAALSEDIKLHILGVIQSQHPSESLRAVLLQYGPEYLETLEKYDELVFNSVQNNIMQTADELNPVASQILPTEQPGVRVDAYLSKRIFQTIGQAIGDALPPTLEKAYKLFEQGLQSGKAPGVDVMCRLIESSGRVKDLDKVRELYTTAQGVLHISPPESQRYEWAAIENSMIIALAHAGHVDAAHVHRMRILDQGLCPSADAYGILVQLVKDTTDDTSGAVVLFEEALARGVRPNLYLYNNIISKLSRARKADYALELFEQMKAGGLTPSSITYGAVIGACARVGDVTAAENLFREMVRNPHFKPRVPPYNTMMQLYTQTKPNRISALYYYNELKKAGVKPSAHTYKLLLDTHGSLEPVALDSMEQVFAELLADESVQVTGAHFASLINAYGCVSKNLDKAINVFESMGTYHRAPKPDAVAFEAIINAIVANKRTDLLPIYVGKMAQLGVHMTAYIANFLIKGYANVGDLTKAREIFEALSNPPMGVAAPNNHAPHSPELSPEVPVMSPVYREPSTWEAMVRAELGAGNRDAALALLERLHERRYPEAVYNRISGILTDFSVL